MTADKRPLKVFLCHAHADRDPVRGLYARLTKDGVDAWLDKENLLAGADWEYEIRKAVREADVVVVCLSCQFSEKGFRQKEVRIALEEAALQPEGEIFIIPARLEECDPPESLHRYHWVDLFENDGYERLMRALRARANKIEATLQIKKNWLPIGNTQPAVVKKPSPSVEKPKKEIQTPKNFNRNIIGVIGFIVLFLASIFGLPSLIGKPEEPNPAITNTAVFKTFTLIPATETKTLILTTVPTKLVTVAPTSLPKEITDDKGVEMVLVPAGEFTMGVDPAIACQNNSNERFDCEKTYEENGMSIHKVSLNAFYIDKYEVTNAKYRDCVSVGKCNFPFRTNLGDINNYYYSKDYDNYPFIGDHDSAVAMYCTWRNAYLPSAAEWEKAARGTDSRIYPWGNESDFSLKANGKNGNDGFPYTAPVGSFPLDVSPYGAFDMGGNVSEIVNGNFIQYYKSGYSYVISYPLKGGDWNLGIIFVYDYGSDFRSGFRCAKSVP